MSIKLSSAYKTIGEVVEILNNEEPRQTKINAHTIRFWEKEFKQIKPKLVNNRRYYTKETVELIKLIKFLLKDKGLTINGVKKILNSNETLSSIDGKTNLGLYKPNLKTAKDKIKKIKKIVAELKEFK